MTIKTTRNNKVTVMLMVKQTNQDGKYAPINVIIGALFCSQPLNKKRE